MKLILLIFCIYTLIFSNNNNYIHGEEVIDLDLTQKENNFHWPGRIIAMGDIHSDGRNAVMMLYKAGLIDIDGHWIAGNTMLIQLGDVVDRGPDTKILYELFRELRSEAEEAGGKVIQLLGNHEPMQICHMLHYVHPQDFDAYGGVNERAKEFSTFGVTGKDIRNWDTAVVVNRTLFVHAGLTPEYATYGIDVINEKVKNALQNNCQDDILWGEKSPLWNRIYSMGTIDDACNDLAKTLHILNADRMIVGHTIQQGGVQLRCSGRLILADTGASRFIQNNPTLVEFIDIGKDTKDKEHRGKLMEYSLEYSNMFDSTKKKNVILGKRELKISISEPPFENWINKIMKSLNIGDVSNEDTNLDYNQRTEL